MKKLILTSYVAHIPEIPSEVRKLTWRLPPSIVVGDGFDLDISPLSVVDKLVIDLATYHDILTNDHEFLNPLRETLFIFHEEGFLELEDFADIAAKHSESLTKLTENALEHPEKWIEPVRQHWEEWDVIQPKIKEAMGRDYDPKVTPIDMGVYSYMYRQGKVNEKEAKRLGKILFSRKKRRSIAERTHLRE